MKIGQHSWASKKRMGVPVSLLLLMLMLVACNFPITDLGYLIHPYATLDPAIFESRYTPTGVFVESSPDLPGAVITPQVDEELYHIYRAQSGDTLNMVANHFRVSPSEINSPQTPPQQGIIPPSQFLVIPKTDANLEWQGLILPDSAVINSPCADDFDVAAFIDSAGGYMSSFSQLVAGDRISGAALVQRVAENQSVSPRLLLAFIEFRAGLVYGNHQPADIYHPLAMNNAYFQGLYQELSLAARMINSGYYGWRYGTINELTLSDDTSIPIAANLNAGSVGIQTLFTRLYSSIEWEDRLFGNDGFLQLYLSMFEDPMVCATRLEPLLTDNVTPPLLQLPFAEGEVWVFTAGPHYTWVEGTPLGALDFAPRVSKAGCIVSSIYARAVATGTVTRSDEGVVMLSLEDENGQPTGWEILYLHIAEQDRVATGTRLKSNDPIGHPSCEGGSATGTHVHIARKFKGEWIGSTELFPFILSGWQAIPGRTIYTGTLINDGQIIFARQGGGSESLISR